MITFRFQQKTTIGWRCDAFTHPFGEREGTRVTSSILVLISERQSRSVKLTGEGQNIQEAVFFCLQNKSHIGVWWATSLNTQFQKHKGKNKSNIYVFIGKTETSSCNLSTEIAIFRDLRLSRLSKCLHVSKSFESASSPNIVESRHSNHSQFKFPAPRL